MVDVNRVVISIAGGLMGLIAGTAVTRPLLAALGPTSVTWNAGSCPAGNYTVTTMAKGPDGLIQSVTTNNVSLPRSAVTQQFPNLRSGTYEAIATAVSNSGTAYWSTKQTINGQGSENGEDAPPERWGRSRAPSNPAIGFARPRNWRPPVEPPREPRLTPNVALSTWVALTAWKRLEAHDLDGDGEVDELTVEFATGEILRVSIRPPQTPQHPR